jgi:predicted dehydrogenase
MISIGVIGYGYWGPNLARCAGEADGCRLLAIADFSSAARERAGKRYPGVKLYSSWQDLLADPTIDAVAIATPVSTHYEIALSALLAGKHVLVEKPMTNTSAQALRLMEESAKRKLVLMVDHTFVFTPAIQKIRDLIVTGKVGDTYYYDSTRINLGLFQHDVNVVWDLAVHDLAILEYLFDERPTAISASGAGHIRGKPENMAHISLFFSSGMVAYLNVNWLAPVKIRQTLIAGSKRMIVYNDLEPSEKVKVYDRGVDLNESPQDLHKLLVSYRTGDMWAPQLSLKEALLTELEHFAGAISAGSTPITSGVSGLNVVSMLESAAASLNRRGTPIEVGLMRRAS